MTTQTVTRALAKRDNGIDKLMWAQASHLESILPEHVDVRSFLGTAWAALLANDYLMQCAVAKPDTLLIALFRCAAKGHQPGTEEYYLTPRDGGILGIEGYRGIIERMYRSGAVAKVIVREVCAKDYFRFTDGEDERPVHHFGARAGTTGADFFGDNGDPDRGDMVGVYAVAQLTTGAWSRAVLLGRSDVYAARASGGWKESDKYSPWNRLDAGPEHPELRGRSMWLKTGSRRLEPWVPTSAEYRREQLRASAAAVTAADAAPALTAAAEDVVTEAEIITGADAREAIPPAARATSGQMTMIGRALGRLGVSDEDRGGVLGKLARRDLTTDAPLTQDEATAVRGLLDKCGEDPSALIELLATGTLPDTGQDGGQDG